ncbi:unnamed protein product [Notodromas monacha]|uniref:Uncharacterized protein n=1 Tax=Notodromas monacha TaxID=399045 RepID=A0A7R9GKB6_9CRUS|nr:unnamed protein product [Notodromas monacha]CAG0924582.1 unnamed protein product [Notodromas monacha]
MDLQSVIDLANQVVKLKMFPLFDVAHSAITCLYIRDELDKSNAKFSRLHPFACWISCMISIFSGSLLTAFLLGEPLLSVFKTSDQLYVATAVWYMVFYAPFDVGYYIVSILPVKCVLAVMKEVYRCKKINDGVVHASRLYPQGYLPILIVGTLKGVLCYSR